MMMKETVRAYIDLMRAHFFFVWPLVFCSGLALSFSNYGGFSWVLVLKAVLIGFFGFEAGLVLNDYVDREIDKKDVDFRSTRYWRLFGRRPISSGLVSAERALDLFFILAFLASLLIATLPYPNSLYVFAIMVYSYALEYFYQIKKRRQRLPFAQLLGRTDFALFPVAGYLCHGSPDMSALLFFVFFYPLVLVHLGINDIIDVENDKVKKMKTVAVLYGMRGNALWILFFSVVHFVAALFFLEVLGKVALYGFLVGFLLLVVVNYMILREKSSSVGIKVLPVFHLIILIYSVSIILEYAF